MTAFQALGGQRLSDQVVTAVRSAILTGRLRPGERLVEADVAAQMGVSRGPVREAFQNLTQQGLLVTHPRRGTFVYELTKGEARHIVRFRAAVEGVAARTVAEERPEAALSRLEQLVLGLEDTGRGDEELRELDIAFHQTLMEAAGNRWALQAWSTLHPFVWLLIGPVQPGHEEVPALGPRHRRVLDALRSGDGDHAEATIRDHIVGPESKLPVIEAMPGDDAAVMAPGHKPPG